MNYDKLKTFLKSLTQFTDTEFENSKNHLYSAHLKKGDFFLEQGKVSREIAFVNSGSLRTYYINETGEEVTACYRFENNLVSSYRSFILQKPSHLSIIALENTELIVIDYEKLQELYHSSMTWLTIGRLIAEQEYINMEQYSSVLNQLSPKEKYLRLIEQQPQVIKISKMEDIASYLGVSRRTLSRIRKEISQ